MPVSVITDDEFGEVTIRRSARSRYIRLTVDARGRVRMSMPLRTPLIVAKTFLHQTRQDVRQNIARIARQPAMLRHGDLVGKTHRLNIAEAPDFQSKLIGTALHIGLPPPVSPESDAAQQYIRQACLKALRTQSKAYLTRRLATLAARYGFYYESVRFSNAGTRWGSCSTRGTISLNIWLMQLPFELIDYVIIHELCHTKQMNHSPQFWKLVEEIIPDYRSLRRTLKQSQPYA